MMSEAPDLIVIFFDAVGTLIETRYCVGEIYSRAAREFGFEAEPRILQLNFERSFRRQPPLAFPAVTPEAALTELEKGWWRNTVEAGFDGLGWFPPFDQLFEENFDRLRGRELCLVYVCFAPML